MTPVLELERTSRSGGGPPSVAVSGQMARGAGENCLASAQTTKSGVVVGSSPSLLDNYAISARRATPDMSWQSRRVRRFYQRYFTGVGVGGRLRFLTLTSSDKAVVEGYDIHRDFRRLVMRIRRRWGVFQYMGVREVKGDREHLHLVFRGEYMAQAQISAMWQEIHASPIVDIQAVYGARGGARYLAKYLAKAVANRYWASYDWVFRGWVGWSQRVKRAVGRYPSKALLVLLARQDKAKRSLAVDFLEGGYRPLWEYTLERADAIIA